MHISNAIAYISRVLGSSRPGDTRASPEASPAGTRTVQVAGSTDAGALRTPARRPATASPASPGRSLLSRIVRRLIGSPRTPRTPRREDTGATASRSGRDDVVRLHLPRTPASLGSAPGTESKHAPSSPATTGFPETVAEVLANPDGAPYEAFKAYQQSRFATESMEFERDARAFEGEDSPTRQRHLAKQLVARYLKPDAEALINSQASFIREAHTALEAFAKGESESADNAIAKVRKLRTNITTNILTGDYVAFIAKTRSP